MVVIDCDGVWCDCSASACDGACAQRESRGHHSLTQQLYFFFTLSPSKQNKNKKNIYIDFKKEKLSYLKET